MLVGRMTEFFLGDSKLPQRSCIGRGSTPMGTRPAPARHLPGTRFEMENYDKDVLACVSPGISAPLADKALREKADRIDPDRYGDPY